MFSRALPLTLLVLMVASLLIADASGGSGEGRSRHSRRKHHRDPRVYDARPSDAEHDDADDDDDDDDDDADDDDDKKGDREHDPTYDHESFLGRDESHRFDELSPKQAQSALQDVLPKIDVNNDSKVTMDELQGWLAAVSKRERQLAADKRFQAIKLFNHALDVHAPMSFEEYKKAIHHGTVEAHEGDKKVLEEFNTQMVRDQARWAKADADGDKLLTKAEFVDFLRPEEAPRMKDIVVQEAMMIADKNKDGKVDLPEFMADLHPTYEADVKEKKKLPKWIEKEEKNFKEKLDTNKDGTLDPSEVYKWVVPEDYDNSRRETLHLFKVADKDNDKNLTKEEIMANWESFVGHKPDPYPREEL